MNVPDADKAETLVGADESETQIGRPGTPAPSQDEQEIEIRLGSDDKKVFIIFVHGVKIRVTKDYLATFVENDDGVFEKDMGSFYLIQ